MTPHPGKTGIVAPSGITGSGGDAGKAGPDGAVVILGALCLFLSTLEYLIPKPLPLIRIGLANLPLMLALDLLSPRYFCLLVLIKIVGAGIVSGTIFSYVFIFSLVGSTASALVMYGLRRLAAGSGRLQPSRGGLSNRSVRVSLAGIGVAGAMCSSGVQLFLARFLVFGEGVRYLVPPFLAASLLTGCVLGLFCEYVCRRSRWYRCLLDPESVEAHPVQSSESTAGCPSFPPPGGRREQRRALRRKRWDRGFNDSELIIAGLIALVLFLINPSTLGRSLQFLFFWFCSWLSGRKNRPLMTVSVIAGIVLVNLLVPYGRVLAEFGPLHITAGSLMDGLRKGITLEGLIMLSATVIRGRPPSGTPVVSTAGPGHGIAARFHSAVFKRITVFGRFLGESLSILAILHEGRGRIRPGHFIDDVDTLLLELGEYSAAVEVEKPEGGQNEAAEQVPDPAPGRLWLVVGLLITASLLTLPLLLSHVRG